MKNRILGFDQSHSFLFLAGVIILPVYLSHFPAQPCRNMQGRGNGFLEQHLVRVSGLNMFYNSRLLRSEQLRPCSLIHALLRGLQTLARGVRRISGILCRSPHHVRLNKSSYKANFKSRSSFSVQKTKSLLAVWRDLLGRITVVLSGNVSFFPEILLFTDPQSFWKCFFIFVLLMY